MRRVTVVLCVGTFVIVVILAALFRWRRAADLDSYRHVIESEFASQLGLIEHKSRELARSRALKTEEAAWKDRREAEADLEVALSSVTQIYEASWAYDAHPHGNHVLKPMRCKSIVGYGNVMSSRSDDGLHSLAYSETESSEPLLVYEGRVPDGEMAFYWIHFRRDAIAEKAWAK